MFRRTAVASTSAFGATKVNGPQGSLFRRATKALKSGHYMERGNSQAAQSILKSKTTVTVIGVGFIFWWILIRDFSNNPKKIIPCKMDHRSLVQ